MAYQWKKQAAVAYGYSLSRLALNYYSYGEECSQSKDRKDLLWEDQQIHEIMGSYLRGEEFLEPLKMLRTYIMKKMEITTAYVDCFIAFEYALNRVERSFQTNSISIDISHEEFVAQIMCFLTKHKDSALMNRRIQMIISQLPVRFTRQKFYSMVLETLSIYIGSPESALEQMLYLLRTTAGVNLTEEEKGEFPHIKQLLDSLEQVSFRNLDISTYNEMKKNVMEACSILNNLSEEYLLLQDLVNDLYVQGLIKDDCEKKQEEMKTIYLLLEGLHEHIKSYGGKGNEISSELTDLLCSLEGLQEDYYDAYERLTPVPIYKIGEDATTYTGRCVEKLLSSSPFVSLEETVIDGILEKKDVEEKAKALFELLDIEFTSKEKPVVRGIMATMLSNLPVCFHSIEDIQTYVENSLKSCSDLAEKETCMELLMECMETEECDGINTYM